MTPVGIADRAVIPVLSGPGGSAGGTGPSGASGQDRTDIFLASGQERSDRLVVGQASAGAAPAPTPTVDGPAAELISASRGSRNDQGGTVGESVLKYMEALHKRGSRVTESTPAFVEPGVKLVIATQPGPAAAALAPPAPQGAQPVADDSFEANLQALQQLQDYAISVNLATNAVATAIGVLKTVTERTG